MAKKKDRKAVEEELSKIVAKKGLDDKLVTEIINQVKHPKARLEEVDLSHHLKEGHVRFGVVSDTQLNNVYARTKDILPTCYHYFRRMKAAFVVHCGDLTDGCLYKNKPIEEMIHKWDSDILRHVIDEYPKVRGLKTYFIGGNDDMTFITKRKEWQKRNIGEEVARRRRDMVYLGMTEANIKLAPRTTLKLLHPLPGIGNRKPYTISYPLQKIINVLEGGEKPDIICVGCYHRLYNFIWRDVHAFLAGTTQNQSPNMRAHQLGADVGAWLLDAYVNKKGELESVEAEVIPFYK